jgi:serralysin
MNTRILCLMGPVILVIALGFAACTVTPTPAGPSAQSGPVVFPDQMPHEPRQCRATRHPNSASANISMCAAQGMKDELDEGKDTFHASTPVVTLLEMQRQAEEDGEEATAAIQLKNKWPNGSSLRVAFLNDPFGLKRHVLKIANEWNSVGGANLKFIESVAADSDIRVTFKGTGFWSYIGQRAAAHGKSEPTLSLSFTSMPTDDYLRRITLHEFGHAIGLLHEHQQPLSTMAWDRQKVLNYFTGPPNCWPVSTVEAQILRPEAHPEEIASTAFDPRSVMTYAIDPRLTTNGKGIPYNNALSATDRTFIAQQYPRQLQ